MRRSPLVAAWRVSREVLREGRDAEPDKSHWSRGVCCLLFPLVSPCAWPPTFPARTEPHWLSHCFLLTFHGDLSRNPGFTADFAAKGSFNALYFHTPSHCDSHPPPAISPSSCHQTEFLSHSSYFSIFFSKVNSSGSQ